MPVSDPVILIPGITATYLTDTYRLPPEEVWSERTLLGAVVGLHKDFERLSLHPDQPSYEARQPARMTVGQIYEVAYRELIEELRDGLPEHRRGPVPVFPFSYDWRQPLDTIEVRLRAFIEEVIDRTRLLGRDQPHYQQCKSVNLVGHSMGGLIIAGYLANCAESHEEPYVNRVATLASPFRGSYDAIVKTATGMGNLGSTAPSPRERKAARVTPSLYHLLPSFEGALQIPDTVAPEEGNWFDPAVWQPSIVASIADYIAEHALNPGNEEEQQLAAGTLFEEFLTQASAHRAKIAGLRLDQIGMSQNQWLCIVGVDANTRVALPVDEADDGSPVFRINKEDRRNEWRSADATDDRYLTGDETVPLRGAIPSFLDPSGVVCVTTRDFEFGEIGDSLLSWLGGFHGILPNMNLVHRLLIRHFAERPDTYRNTWGRALPRMEGTNWNPPMQLEERDDVGA